jgi:hypothetical protein
MKTITLYHGSAIEINIEKNKCMYFTSDINEAKNYALGLNNLGKFNEHSFIYSTEINVESIEIEEDFGYFDCIGYTDYKNMPEFLFNPKSNYYCLKNVCNLKLIKSYKN